MTELDIVERLRGKVRVHITDGLGRVTPEGSDDFFERSFPTSNLAKEAADYIERLRGQFKRIWSLHYNGNDTDLVKVNALITKMANIAKEAGELK